MNTPSIINDFCKQFPLIKIFQYNKNCFAFDGKSNLLAEISPEDIKMLTDISLAGNFSKDRLGKYYDLISNGAFLPNSLQQITPNKTDIKRIVEYNFNQVIPRKFILEVTQNCTLRCQYCYFSENNQNRTHSEVEMSKDIAKNAIDLYFKIYTESISDLSPEIKDKILKVAVPNLSWWGGEPFLNFELIKWSKCYFESLPWAEFGISPHCLVYSVVTNFTIVNDEILDFLVANNVYTFISLDGNKEHHDKNRVFAYGKGSFDPVKRNIDVFIDKYPGFCKKYVSLQSVKADNIDHSAAYAYLIKTFGNKVLKCQSYQQSYWGKEKSKEHEAVFIQNQKYYDEFYTSLNDLTNQKFNEVMDSKNDYYDFFKDIFSLEKRLVFDNPKGSDNHARMFSCPIGIDVVFVDASGQIHMCNKSDYSYPIGDVNNGINIDDLIDLLEVYHSAIEPNCKDCWAFSFCKVCPATTMLNRKFKVRGSDVCNLTRETFYDRIYGYIILSYYPNVYDKAREYGLKKAEDISFLTFEGAIYKNSINF